MNNDEANQKLSLERKNIVAEVDNCKQIQWTKIKWHQSFNLITTFLSTHSPAQWTAVGQYEIQNPLLPHPNSQPFQPGQHWGQLWCEAQGGLTFGGLLLWHHGHARLLLPEQHRQLQRSGRVEGREGEAAWKRRHCWRSWHCRELSGRPLPHFSPLQNESHVLFAYCYVIAWANSKLFAT